MKTFVLKPIGDAKHADDADCPDAGWKPLTRHQKTRLVLLAKKGWESAKDTAGTAALLDFDAWRQEVAIRVCGCRISEARQEHWADLKAEFQSRAGDDAGAFRTQLREGDNKRRIAMHKLTEALAKKGLPVTYAAAICRTQYKCSLDEASARQLWRLFYTVRNRKR